MRPVVVLMTLVGIVHSPLSGQHFERDRQAILAMAGEYKVTFNFEETVGVEPEYKLRSPYTSGGTEWVTVLADSGNFISLQHILVLHFDGQDEAHVVKHWRQDWRYEDARMNVFQGNRTWAPVAMNENEVAGTWTQAVFQVDDSPRYESTGRWTHVGNRSSWQSDETWRPLPRREFSTRDDYDVLVAKNRHTITGDGWVHEQDNYKLVLNDVGQPARVLAHEVGVNTYERIGDVDFSAGVTYWDDTQAFWAAVRNVWDEVLSSPTPVTLAGRVDEQTLFEFLFEMADVIREHGFTDPDEMRANIHQRIASFIVIDQSELSR